MSTRQYDNFNDLVTFTRSSGGTALRPVGYGTELASNDVSDWVPFNGGSAVQDGEWIVVTGATANTSGIDLVIPTVPGTSYIWSMEIELLTATVTDTQITETTSNSDAMTPSSYNYVNSNRTINYTRTQNIPL